MDIEKIQKMFEDMDENVIVLILSVFTTFIVVVFGIYFMYMYNLKNKECEVMNSFYPQRNTTISNITTSLPLNNYCIKAAYNCCSLGSYKNDYVGTCILSHILKQGVRFLDFEIFSIDDFPVVATSINNNFNEKETYNYVQFNEVMSIINSTAFNSQYVNNSGDPLIIHLRFKSNNQKMFNALLQIFQTYDLFVRNSDLELQNPKNPDKKNLGKTSIDKLKGKISLIVDDSLKICDQCKVFKEYINMRTNTDQIRLYPYYDIRQATSNTLTEMYNYNTPSTNNSVKSGMTICIPDRDYNPGNPNLLVTNGVTGKLGIDCNIVAMRYQHVDDNLLIYNNVFDYSRKAFLTKTEMNTALQSVLKI